VGAGEEPLALIGHAVLLPAATPHRMLRLVADVDLLLAATMASVRMSRPMIGVRAAGIPGGGANGAGRPTRRPGRSSRTRGDHEVDGGGGAVKFVGVELTFVVGSVVIFLVALGVGLFLAVSP
jgi:hypothetical protein